MACCPRLFRGPVVIATIVVLLISIAMPRVIGHPAKLVFEGDWSSLLSNATAGGADVTSAAASGEEELAEETLVEQLANKAFLLHRRDQGP